MNPSWYIEAVEYNQKLISVLISRISLNIWFIFALRNTMNIMISHNTLVTLKTGEFQESKIGRNKMFVKIDKIDVLYETRQGEQKELFT